MDFEANEVRLDPGMTKNGQGRVIKMNTEVRALLEARRKEADELKANNVIVPLVFFRMVAQGRRGAKKPKRITSFGKSCNACRLAGCPGRIPHDLRRTAVRNYIRDGVPEVVAMAYTGHETESVFRRYNIVSQSDLADAAQRTSGRHVVKRLHPPADRLHLEVGRSKFPNSCKTVAVGPISTA